MKFLIVLLLFLSTSVWADDFNLPTPITRPQITQMSLQEMQVNFDPDGKTVNSVRCEFSIGGVKHITSLTDRRKINVLDLSDAEKTNLMNYLMNNLNTEGEFVSP